MVSSTIFYTVGHSNRSQDQLIALLRDVRIEHVVDVRAMPRSRTNPQFNQDVFAERLKTVGIGYSHCAALAGLRSRSRTVADDVNGYWRNRSFQNYADYALSATFQEALNTLIDLGRRTVCAVMCAEAVWWRCHRRIIADHLLHRDERVFHLLSPNRAEPATMTAAAHPGPDGVLTYPAANN